LSTSSQWLRWRDSLGLRRHRLACWSATPWHFVPGAAGQRRDDHHSLDVGKCKRTDSPCQGDAMGR
jgi:hypothetical protein